MCQCEMTKNFALTHAPDSRKYYYGVVIRKLLYTRRDQTRGNVVTGGRSSWGGDTAAIKGAKYSKKEHLENYFRFD